MVNVIKKLICILFAALMAVTALCSCDNDSVPHSDKLSIVTTIFPYYEFSREIAGDKAEVVQLISPGSEIHNFEPTPKDILKISDADLFIYNGGESDEWVEGVLESIDSDVKVLRMFDYADLIYEEDIEHNKGDEYDEHIWTSISNDKKLVSAISSEIINSDKSNKTFYETNTRKYINKLNEIDSSFKQAVNSSARKPMVVADRFPLLYFVKEYGIAFESAFPGCTSETQPSIKTVTKLINYVRSNDVPVVFHIDNSSDSLARTICEDSEAEIKTFYSMHNITREQFDSNTTFISLLELNLSSIKEALG